MNLMNLDGESFRTLPTLHPEASNFTAAGRSGVGVSEQLNDLRRTILSLAYDRSSGIEPTDWVNAVRYFLGPIADPFLVLRAWQESGRISVVSQARWNRWRIFPEVPTLAIYKTFEGFQAIGAGLWAPEQEGSIGSVMTCQSWEQKHSHSIGNLSPQMHRWTGGSESEKTPSFIKEACLQESIRLCSLDVTRLIGEWGTGQYDSPGLIAPDSEEVITYEVPGLGEISQHRRRSSPKFWSVPGNPYCWSYSRPLALALLSKEKGEQPYLKIGTNAIGTIHSQIHIPLPFARLAAWTGPAAPGPAHASGHVNGRWIYEFPSQGVRDEIYSRISLDLRKRQQQLPEVHNA